MATQILPEQYQPNANLRVKLSDQHGAHSLALTVLRAFTPFTISQVLHVEPAGALPASLPTLGPSLILKVYDPRFYKHRFTLEPPLPWTLAAETIAAQNRNGRGRDPNFDPLVIPETDDDAPGWEEWYFQQAERQYYAEACAYARLIPLQGTGIPRMLGAGTLDVSDRAISPRVMLLEYIPDAVRLDAVGPGVVPIELALGVVETMWRIGELEVVHGDLNPGNILFSPAKHPTRAVIIDFGHSAVREEEDDKEWENVVLCNSDRFYIKNRLGSFLSMDEGILDSRVTQRKTPLPTKI